MTMNRIAFSSIVLAGALLLQAGCSSSAPAEKPTAADTKPAENEKKPASTVPVTVKIGIPPNGYYNDREFEQFIVAPVKKKFPHITIERVEMMAQDPALEKLIVAGAVPDMLIGSSLTMDPFVRLKLVTEMEPLVKQYSLDLARFNPVAIDYTKSAGGESKLLAIPYNYNYSSVAYNKDLFDKFGVPYPKDGLTIEEMTDLARKLTKLDGGVQYRGLELDTVIRPSSVQQLQYIDPKTNKAIINTDKWKTFMETIKAVYQIPGNSEVATAQNALNQLLKDKRLAMLATLNLLTPLEAAGDLNWDLAQYPQFAGAPNTGVQFGAHVAMINPFSTAKEAVMNIISVMVSDEVQLDAAKNGRRSILNNSKLQDEFGTNLAFLKGKNVKAIFKATPARPLPTSKYDSIGATVLNNIVKATVQDGKDINTALREGEDEINKKITETK